MELIEFISEDGQSKVSWAPITKKEAHETDEEYDKRASVAKKKATQESTRLVKIGTARLAGFFLSLIHI